MRNIPGCFRRWLLCIGQLGMMAVAALNAPLATARDTPTAAADATNNAEADKAWKAVRKATQEPMPPPEWQQQKPDHEEVAKFYTAALHKGADAAKDFYTRFPNHPKAAEARKLEYKLLNMAIQRFGDDTQT